MKHKLNQMNWLEWNKNCWLIQLEIHDNENVEWYYKEQVFC